VDYEIGYDQELSFSSVIKFSAFYKEYRDNIQARLLAFAYPRDYISLENIDFGTTKGLTVEYQLRQSPQTHVGLMMAYTLQIAKGTGSSATSQLGIINAGQPNLKAIIPLSFDSRHTINTTFDFRFGRKKDYAGPRIGGKDILENAGANLVVRASSGTPYTRQSNPGTIQGGQHRISSLAGSLNGARLPWRVDMDFQFDKIFQWKMGGKKEGKAPKIVNVRAILVVHNLLNIRNVISVYSYTGDADDDGYLLSPNGQIDIDGLPTEQQQQSLIDLYTLRLLYSGNYSLPRRIRLGVEFGF